MSAAITERVLPKYVSRIEGGGKVRFGPFTITREGIAKDGEEIAWPNVADVGISNGMIYVEPGGSAARHDGHRRRGAECCCLQRIGASRT